MEDDMRGFLLVLTPVPPPPPPPISRLPLSLRVSDWTSDPGEHHLLGQHLARCCELPSEAFHVLRALVPGLDVCAAPHRQGIALHVRWQFGYKLIPT